MPATFFFLGLALLIVIGVILLVRSGKISEKYAVLWLVVGVIAIVLAAYPPLLTAMAELVGVYVPSNLLFALSILLLVGVCMHLSLEVSRLEDRVRRLAEESAILRHETENRVTAGEPHIAPPCNPAEPTGFESESGQDGG